MSSLKEIEHKIKEILTSLHYDKEEAASICRRLITEILSISDTKLFLIDKDTQLSIEEEIKANNYIKRLNNNDALQYIISKADFYKYQFFVDKSVLIPRPETEELCLMAIDEIRKLKKNSDLPIRIWDICTGSSAIAYTLAMELGEKDYILASDISREALLTAKINIDRLPPDRARVELLCSDILLEKGRNTEDFFDIIISNPPYIQPSEALSMADNVLKNEPHIALFAPEDDPIVFYKAIAELIKKDYLKKDGLMLFEINPLLAEETKRAVSKKSGIDMANIEIIKDIYGKERFIKIRNK